MIDKIEEIAKAIERHRNLEITIDASNEAVARSEVNYNGTNIQFWITNKANKGGHQKRVNIVGFALPPEVL